MKFHHGKLGPIAAAAVAVAAEAAIPASVHLDHVEDRDLLHLTADSGASSAMFDASTLDYDANVAATRGRGLGTPTTGCTWKPSSARSAVRTAPRPGSAHRPRRGSGVRRRDRRRRSRGGRGQLPCDVSARPPSRFRLCAQLRASVPVPLVLHGSSGVPTTSCARGRAGITKINIGTPAQRPVHRRGPGFPGLRRHGVRSAPLPHPSAHRGQRRGGRHDHRNRLTGQRNH